MAEELVTVDWSNEEELLKEEEEEEKKAEEAAKEAAKEAEKNEAKNDEKKDEAMDTSDVKEEEVKKTLLASVLRGPVKVTNLHIKDLLARELQGVLHKSVNTQIDFVTKVGTIHLNFDPKNDKQAVDILRKLARFQHANKEIKIQCSRSVACLLGFELRKQGVGPAPPGTLQFDKVLFLYNIPAETTEEVLRAMFECPICIIPLDEEGNNFGCAFLEFRSKKAAKACHSTNTEFDIGEVKCTLYHKYLIGGTKEEDDEVEKEERERKKKEQDRKSVDGQKKKGNQQRGAGKSYNRGQAFKHKFNRARQMGQFDQGGFSGDMGQGVSQNLMMNQMMAMMRMNQNMGGGSGGMGRGMGRGMNRMGGQRPMSASGYSGGYDDFSSDYGFDDYESGYGGGRNMGGGMGGGRRQQQMMGGNRRGGQMGSESNNQRDSVVDLFESALDTVDTQM